MQRLFRFAQRSMPRISQTERIALESGTSGIERHVFAGRLTAAHLAKYSPLSPTANDVKMLERVPELLATVDEYATLQARTTPHDHPFWTHAKRRGFFGLIVPERYGGTPLSSSGLSHLLQLLSSASASVPVHVMVPASLGPAELLVHYGTQAQCDHFLPKLAQGAIPCFGLTSLHAGSDAAGSMVDTGLVVERGGELRLRIRCDKRYITLAPVADIVGLAFKIEDPEGLLGRACGRNVHGEITLALVERGTPGLELGPRTDPLGVGFANGTVVANDVDIGLDAVIGGIDGVGEGWKYLMEALAAGRGIALPAGAAGSSKMLTNAVAAYAKVRRQFKVEIAAFEGIQEKLADMTVKTLEIDSLVALMNCALDEGERPPILSAILKQRTTELGRDVVGHAMDIVAGSAICMGPQNFVAPAYLSNPIGITVEGSNTMTRSLLIFGQGVVRSHPHLLPIIRAIDAKDRAAFSAAVFAATRDVVGLLIRPVLFDEAVDRYVRFFALSANASLLLGGELKRREFLSGRYADMLSFIVAYRAVEWHSRRHINVDNVAKVARQRLLHRLEATGREIVANHPHRLLHKLLWWRTLGPSSFAPAPSDAALARVAKEVTLPRSGIRSLFAQHTTTLHPNVARLTRTMEDDDPEATRRALHDAIMRVDTFCDQTFDRSAGAS